MENAQSWTDYWRQPDGSIPKQMTLLADMDVDIAQTYTQLRSNLFQQKSEGFTVAQKELLFAIVDIFCNHAYGARFHIRNALREGIPLVQVREALSLVILTRGINDFAEIGWEIWEECHAFQTNVQKSGQGATWRPEGPGTRSSG